MKNHSVLYFLIFICSLVLGYCVSTRFYGPNLNLRPSTMRLVATGSQNSIETMKNGQRSILLIGATSINTPNPHLESIWLATYFSTDPTIRLLPIFPAGNRPISAFEQQLARDFNLGRTNGIPALNRDFIKDLSNNNYWWSGYIVFDEVALTRIIDLMGGIDLKGRILSGAELVKELPIGLDHPQEAYSSQMAIFQSACHKFQALTSGPGMSELGSLLPKHILTDLNPSQLQTEMQFLFTRQRNPTCRFPTLEISQVVH
jgi:hypothetical protein